MRVFFRHEQPRKGQFQIMKAVAAAVKQRKILLLQAHTGYGKTDAVLSAALSASIENGMKLLFLTPKKTQHALSMQIISQLNRQHGLGIKAVDIMGKREYCISRAREVNEFYEYCKLMRKKGVCPYYVSFKRTRPRLSGACGKQEALQAAGQVPPCPYEVLLDNADDADVIVGDYNYLFSGARRTFLARTGISLPDTVLVVDEAHNLPGRIRENLSATITRRTLKKAIKEHEELGEDPSELRALERLIPSYSEGRETVMEKAEVPVPDLESIRELGLEWLENHESSSLIRTYNFFRAWEQEGPEFFRILKTDGEGFALSIKCLDPGEMAGSVLSKVGSAIFMSATLSPFEMYARLMRLKEYQKKVAPPIFPAENRVCVISSSATSRWKERTKKGYEMMAWEIEKLAGVTPGNTVAFFPSFEFLEQISRVTKQEIIRQDRVSPSDIIHEMGEKKVLLYAVSGGSLAEGVNLPEVKTVVIAGLPLPAPDVERLALQEYYNRVFGNGFEYAFLYPAVKKSLQAAGRCIRRGDQKGAIVFLDYRFRKYLKMIQAYYPDVMLEDDPENIVRKFWSAA